MKNNKKKLVESWWHIFQYSVRNFIGPGIFPLAKFLRYISYVSWSRYVCRGINALPHFSIVYLFMLCHGYSLTLYMQCCG